MTSALPARGRLAGIDFGTVRIGVALSDAERRVASPYVTYRRIDREADARWFRQLVEDERIVGFVVGLPVHASGQESQKSGQARRFGQWLSERTGRPVVFYDERYSSAQAEQLLVESRGRKRKHRERLDQLAAQIILAAFLESSGQCDPPGPLDD